MTDNMQYDLLNPTSSVPASDESEVLLRVEHLCQYFGFNKAVDDVTFDIKRGEVFGLVGESGCGKTTTGRSIIKLYNITSGSIYFKGVRIGAGIQSYKDDIAKAKEDCKAGTITAAERDAIITDRKAQIASAKADMKNVDKEYAKEMVAQVKAKYEPLLQNASPELLEEYKNELRKAKKARIATQIQMIFQDPIASLDPRMTVKEIISEGLIIRGERNKKVIDQKVYEMLELVGLVREHADRYPHEFSGGQRQRIGVARAIIMNPELIIADEPVSALDVSIQAQVINLLNDLRRDLGLTILFVAHDLSVVKYFSDRIGVMYFGKMVELATSDELFKNPLHPYTRSLLSAIPLPDPRAEKAKVLKVYDPSCHDYSVDKPIWAELEPGHFVLGNQKELDEYRKQLI